MYIVKLDASGNTCANSTSPPSISGSRGTTISPTPTVTSPTSIVTTPTSLSSTGGTVTNICTFVGIQPISNETPGAFRLEQNYPNPFNPSTNIRFALPKNSFVKLVVYDVLGRELETILNEQLNAGSYEVSFDGSKLSSGIYYYKLSAASGTNRFTETKRMVLIK